MGDAAERIRMSISRAIPLAILSFAVCSGCGGDVPDNQRYVHGTMNLRAGPGTSYDPIGQVHRGDTIRLMPQSSDGWSQVEGTSAFIYSEHRNIRAEPARPIPDYSRFGPCAEKMAETFRAFNGPPKDQNEQITSGLRTVTWRYSSPLIGKQAFITFQWGTRLRRCETSILRN